MRYVFPTLVIVVALCFIASAVEARMTILERKKAKKNKFAAQGTKGVTKLEIEESIQEEDNCII